LLAGDGCRLDQLLLVQAHSRVQAGHVDVGAVLKAQVLVVTAKAEVEGHAVEPEEGRAFVARDALSQLYQQAAQARVAAPDRELVQVARPVGRVVGTVRPESGVAPVQREGPDRIALESGEVRLAQRQARLQHANRERPRPGNETLLLHPGRRRVKDLGGHLEFGARGDRNRDPATFDQPDRRAGPT
jgi:hypothetical protein